MKLLKTLIREVHYYCPNCHENYIFTRFKEARLIRKYGRIGCYYCRHELEKLS